ncbi:FAD-binding and (Fe-S)-binding domain-containing protein [Arcticibacterium luteifluviistationis]|uniref:FAD-binding oxidoreductase n=1 Tax=Arcticibacterium luteifluviistationis TaxID=1784714 RepID=A0A2Z4GGM8_9BACT|nr:FAD-binding and (Fe-S)-binding domain-containing protein [Arcticibacterium luteifluviistationis]AWV99953.1 FAD-binding oxidoreductase [Arcticibacterium luteifluviistationis]
MNFSQITNNFKGKFLNDNITKTLYATDASAYREIPLAVAFPENEEDIKTLIKFANKKKVTLIPRTAGTSLAGQVVGKGIIVDVSKTFTKILEVNKEESWVRLQPAVVRDELNHHLKDFDLFFGPETSTANRAMVGGMVGNNSCGTNSVYYGSTRDHLLSVKGFLSDGSEVEFKSLTTDEFEEIIEKKRVIPTAKLTLEDKIYLNVFDTLSNSEVAEEIREQFPKRTISRRNTGYAIDELLETKPFTPTAKDDFNFCKLIAGSEGTLMFITEIKIHVNEMPPKYKCVVAGHFETIDDSLKANIIALKYNPSAVELMDHYILECTKANKEQMANRFFVEGDPKALLCIELFGESIEIVKEQAAAMEVEMRAAGYGYHFPILFGDDIKKVWTLRKAGLGLLSNLPGDEKAVPVIEDTAVDVNDLPAFIEEFNVTMAKRGLSCVHYAHAGSGELHLRPIINLKTKEGNQQFRDVAQDISTLVKKYKGSLSGEHGDGRLRAEFIPQQIGEKNYQLLRKLKYTWDPYGVFNANKIVDTPAMNEMLRYEPGQITPKFETVFRFKDQDILQHAEQCNGSGDCRKTEISGGTMCPSFMATKDEKHTTRARANILREALTRENGMVSFENIVGNGEDRFDNKEVKEVLDLCLLCKGCKSECPSNVDMAKLKMEFMYHYQKKNGVPVRSKMIANFSKMSKLGAIMPSAYNFIFKNEPIRRLANKVVGFHPDRTMPLLHSTTLLSWYKKNASQFQNGDKGKVYLFCDEFSNYNDVTIGQTAIKLLSKLGYAVIIPDHVDSGRPYLSKGMLDEGKERANLNVEMLHELISEETPLIGIEPSCILAFRDDYPELVNIELAEKAEKLAKNALMIDEFIAREIDKKKLDKSIFTDEEKLIKLHGHCQQKAVSSMVPTKKMLSLPPNYNVQLIPSGCCGMSGSFGYEKEHYDISMKIGELVLFPTVREQPEEVIIAAPGTSCRHQIHDGTGRKALHPVEVLWGALR